LWIELKGNTATPADAVDRHSENLLERGKLGGLEEEIAEGEGFKYTVESNSRPLKLIEWIVVGDVGIGGETMEQGEE
jgi:hypothetical protein